MEINQLSINYPCQMANSNYSYFFAWYHAPSKHPPTFATTWLPRDWQRTRWQGTSHRLKLPTHRLYRWILRPPHRTCLPPRRNPPLHLRPPPRRFRLPHRHWNWLYPDLRHLGHPCWAAQGCIGFDAWIIRQIAKSGSGGALAFQVP